MTQSINTLYKRNRLVQKLDCIICRREVPGSFPGNSCTLLLHIIQNFHDKASTISDARTSFHEKNITISDAITTSEILQLRGERLVKIELSLNY